MPADLKGYIQLAIGLTAPSLGGAVPSNPSFQPAAVLIRGGRSGWVTQGH